MSILSQSAVAENEVLDCVERFFSKHHIGKLLSKCNGTKEKEVPAISILRYKLGNIFTSGGVYMQHRTGSFEEGFSKNTFYRILNSRKKQTSRDSLRCCLLASSKESNIIGPVHSYDKRIVQEREEFLHRKRQPLSCWIYLIQR